MQILRSLKHENIIEMLDSFETPEEFCVVTEFAQVHTARHGSVRCVMLTDMHGQPMCSQQLPLRIHSQVFSGVNDGQRLLKRVRVQGELFEILELDSRLPEQEVQAIAKQLVRQETSKPSSYFLSGKSSLTPQPG